MAKAPAKKSKKKTNSKKKSNKQLSLFEILSKREVSASITFVCGLVLLIIAFFSGGENSFWYTVHSMYFAIFGITGYYIPLTVLFFGVVCLLGKQNRNQLAKASELMLLFTIIASLLHVNVFADINVGYFDAVSDVFSVCCDMPVDSLTNGGVIGALVGGAVFQMCKSVALSNVILVLLTVAVLMFLFGVTLVKLFTEISKPVKKAETVIEKSRDDLSRRIQERNEIKASKNENVQVAKIVNDFIESNSQQEKKKRKTEQPRENKSEDDKSFEVDSSKNENLFTFAELVKQNQNDNSSSLPDEVVKTISVESDKQSNKETKPEKLEPLSKEEQKEINDSLNEGVNQTCKVEYVLPSIDCLNPPKEKSVGYDKNELETNGNKLIAALESFNVSASIVGVVPGPTVTRYELLPAPGVKISKFTNLSDDLALHLAAPAGLRIEAPIPNKSAIGVEIPNKSKTTVTFRESIDNDKFRNAKSKLNVALGKDISGVPMFCDLAKMPHLLVAGTTGSGKSVCLNSMIVSILYNASPDEVKILLIDPKQVEFGVYNGLPHLLVPVVSDPRKAAGALGWAVTEMLNRYKTLNANGVRDIAAYNSLCDVRDDLEKLPQIVIFIDELADLMSVAQADVEDSIQRLAQMARAAGMHLVVATQRPSADVITGVIKSNIPSRIALTVKSYIDSKIIIDTMGAEKLMGYGDMLYYPVGEAKPVRIQGCYLSDTEIERVVTSIKSTNSSEYSDEVQQEIERQASKEKKKTEESASAAVVNANDELLNRAIELFVNAPDKASISALQRHLGLGFAKAGRLMDTLEEKGIVGPHMGSKPRNVLITKSQWYEMSAMSSETTDTALNNDFTDSSEENN